MKKISASGMTGFNNAYHVNFHSNVMGLINQYEAANLGIADVLAEKYEQDIARLQDAVLRSTAAQETEALRKADEERDQLFRYVRNTLSNTQYSPLADVRELYAVAKAKILNVYGPGIVSESDNEESAHIRGFLMDVRQYFRTSITKLGLADALEALEKANDEFQSQYLTRIGNQAYYGTELTKKLRAQVDEDYQRIATHVEYNGQQIEAIDDKTVGLRDNSQSFIDAVNQLIVRTKQSIAMGKNSGNGNDNGDDNGGGNGNDQQPTTNDQSGNDQTPDKDTSKPSGPGNPNENEQPDRPSGDNPNINYGGDLDEVPSEV